MGLIVLFFCSPVLIPCIIFLLVFAYKGDSWFRSGKRSYGGRRYRGSYPAYYDEDDYAKASGAHSSGYKESYSDYETRAARGEREYFSDDPARDYMSYNAQIADDMDSGYDSW